MNSIVSKFAARPCGEDSRFKIAAKCRGAGGFLLFAFGVAIGGGVPSAVHAAPVSVTADSGLQQRADATVTVKDSRNNKAGTGKTAVPAKEGGAKFTTDLGPGTYANEAEWRNRHVGIESDTFEYSATTGRNQRNVEIAEGGDENPPRGGGAANGITPTGLADRDEFGLAPGIGGFRFSVNGGANFQWGDGIIALPQYTGGVPDGVHGLEADVDHVGSSFGGNIGYGINMPKTGAGAQRVFFGFSGQSSWGESVTKMDQITPRAGSNFEVHGLNLLANIATTQVNDVEARTAIDELEFQMRMGLIYDLGEYGASIGNLIFGEPSRAMHKRIEIAIFADLIYRYRERDDQLGFTNAGVENRYDSQIDTNEFGGRLSVLARVPVGGITFSGGPFAGIYGSDDDLSANYRRGATPDSFSTSEDKLGFEVGFSAALSAKLGPGILSGMAKYTYKSDTAMLHLRESNSDTTGIDYTDFQQFTIEAKYKMPFDGLSNVLSDIRLKTDIVRLGTLPSGLPVYSFKYVWSPVTHIGVIAQEAMMRFPYAVHEVDGYLAVDYSQIR